MNPVNNPYAPGAGQRPPELAGREPERDRFKILLDRLQEGRAERGIMLTGLRGVGKTVLLEELRSMAEQQDWVVAFVEAESSRPFRLLASQALISSLRATSLRHRSSARLRDALGVLKAFSLKALPDGSISFGMDLNPTAGRADSGDLEVDLAELLVELGEAAADFGAGVILLIDEIQELSKYDIAAVAGAVHQTNRLQLPVAVAGAGLPNLPAVLTKAKSYAERLFTYHRIDALNQADATEALDRPAEVLGVKWQRAALSHVVAASKGYPYFLQVFGKSIWDSAPGPNTITAHDARLGVESAQSELDEGFYGTRWQRATPGQHAYLIAMAEESKDDSPVSTGRVAARLGKPLRAVGLQRDQLIRKGLIYPPERGLVAFTVPGMSDYIKRHAT